MKLILSAIFYLFLLAGQAQTYIVKNIKSFGAKGDGKTSDQAAFKMASEFFNKRGGNGKLIIPKGIYLVGNQVFTGGQLNKPAYLGEDVLHFTNIKNFTIKGSDDAILKYINGVRIGTFSPKTGEVYNHGNTTFTDRTYAAIPGMCIIIENGQNIQISNLTLDGNSKNMIVGGIYGDKGWQLPHYGIFIMNSRNVMVNTINAHHFGLDGICVSNKVATSPDSISITNSTFEYNSRQGLSWVGGNQLYVKNCKFNHTGRGKFYSSPGAGLDIEGEVGPIRNGVFDHCEFINNIGLGMGADSGDSGDCTFNDCTFWGSTNFSLWVTKPNFTFTRCNIYGSAARGYSSPDIKNATKFFECLFEDKPYNGQPPYGKYLVESNESKRMNFSNCTFVTNTKKICWLASPNTFSDEEKYQLNNCKFIIRNSNLPQNDFVGITRGVIAKNCTFTFTDSAKKKGYNFGETDPATSAGFSGTKIIYEVK
jgi:hypothetical protein